MFRNIIGVMEYIKVREAEENNGQRFGSKRERMRQEREHPEFLEEYRMAIPSRRKRRGRAGAAKQGRC